MIEQLSFVSLRLGVADEPEQVILLGIIECVLHLVQEHGTHLVPEGSSRLDYAVDLVRVSDVSEILLPSLLVHECDGLAVPGACRFHAVVNSDRGSGIHSDGARVEAHGASFRPEEIEPLLSTINEGIEGPGFSDSAPCLIDVTEAVGHIG